MAPDSSRSSLNISKCCPQVALLGATWDELDSIALRRVRYHRHNADPKPLLAPLSNHGNLSVGRCLVTDMAPPTRGAKGGGSGLEGLAQIEGADSCLPCERR